MCDNDGTADDFEVFYIELDDANDCNPVGVSAGATADTVYAYDIFKIDSNMYVLDKEDNPFKKYVLWDVTSAPLNNDFQFTPDDSSDFDASFVAVVGSDAYYPSWDFNLGVTDYFRIFKIDPDAGGNKIIYQSNGEAGWKLATDKNLYGMAYDGSDLLFFHIEKQADNKNHFMEYSIISDSWIEKTESKIALMMDRNNLASVPNEVEKGFGIIAPYKEFTYELFPNRNGNRQLQDCNSLSDADLIAITDNFLMNDDGDMFEFQNITNEISTIRYNGGIMGVEKKGSMIIHPDFENRWSKEDSIKIYDQYDQLEFWGKIIDKNRNRRGLYVIKFDSFTNEVLYRTYETDYLGDDTDTKQKDIIDNGLDFCYRDSSIVGTTTTYDYEYNRAIIYLFWLARRLERQVPYIEPDGKIWTKAHDGLAKNAMIYPGTFNFKDDTVGGDPTGWVLDEDGGTINVIAELDGHKKVVELHDTSAVNAAILYNDFDGNQSSGTTELFVRSTDFTDQVNMYLREGTTTRIWIRFDADKITYRTPGGAFNDITGGSVSNNTWYRIRVDFDCATDTFDFYLNGSLTDAGLDFRAAGNNINRFQFQTSTDTNYFFYLDAVGYSWDPAYTVGDNEVAWDLNNHWQDVQFVDIPGIEEVIQGFFDGNSGITRNNIRYRDNTITIRPVAATRDPIEQLKGILSLNEFRDPKIIASTEANQLGDNRYAIWAADTIFLGLNIKGQGYLQPGKTIHIENTGQIPVAESNLLLLSFTRDPKNDVYSKLILSDNIIFPSEFSDLDNTSRQQIHTSTMQSIKNQSDIIAHLTPEGGLALRLTNKTGGTSVKGTIVEAHAATNNAFRVCDANSVEAFGIVYEDGIADGAECIVVIGGRCQVLLKDATLSTRNNWAGVSDVAGRADCTGVSPPAQPAHFKEIGHCIESKGADTDVLAFIMAHYL